MFKNPKKEFIQGETQSIIIDIVQKYIKEHENETRRVDLLNDFLDVNNGIQSASEKRKQVKSLLKGYSVMNSTLRKKLEGLGCVIIEGKKHYKIRYHGDPRYQVSMAKTGSDRRAGENLASAIIKIML